MTGANTKSCTEHHRRRRGNVSAPPSLSLSVCRLWERERERESPKHQTGCCCCEAAKGKPTGSRGGGEEEKKKSLWLRLLSRKAHTETALTLLPLLLLRLTPARFLASFKKAFSGSFPDHHHFRCCHRGSVYIAYEVPLVSRSTQGEIR